jgi:hypothetical protein
MIDTAPISRQYQAELNMLQKAIEQCPDELWLSASGLSPNRYWHIAYHTLFYVHFYQSPTDADFTPWPHHRPNYNFLGANPRNPNEVFFAEEPYMQAELLDYLAFCRTAVDNHLAAFNPEAPSGFFWLPFDRLELQFYNLRHIAHHTGQLVDRLRSHAGTGVGWSR